MIFSSRVFLGNGNVLLSHARKWWSCYRFEQRFWTFFCLPWPVKGVSDLISLAMYVLSCIPEALNRVLKTGQSYKTRGHHSVDTTPSHFPYSPLNVCGSLLNFVSFFSKLKFRPFSSSSMFFLVSCSFSSIIAICLAKSNWFLGPFCCSWDSFSLRSTISLSLSIRVSLRRAFSFSLAVKI